MATEEILSEINKKLSDTSTIISSAYVKLYTNDNKNSVWKDSSLSGILVLLVERSLQTILIRLYEFEKYEMVFETELFFNFFSHYIKLSKVFHCFPITGGQIGISFSDSKHSENFYEKVKIYSPKEKIRSNQSENNSSDLPPNWIDKIKNKVLKKKENSGKGKVEISKPYAVQLVSRVGWDEVKNSYILDSLPGELRRIFIVDTKDKSIEGSVSSNGLRNLKGTFTDREGLKNNSKVREKRPTLSYRNLRINTFEDLEEKILGSRKSTIKDLTPKKDPNKQGGSYYKLLANKIAERRAELEKYNISEECSESSSNT